MKTEKRVLGDLGENAAAKYLRKNKYRILERNFMHDNYEIDIIAKDKDTLVFCEVKTRKTTVCGSPFEAITKSKYQNIKKGIFFYLQENSNCKKFRVDAISIVLEPKLEIKHLKNI